MMGMDPILAEVVCSGKVAVNESRLPGINMYVTWVKHRGHLRPIASDRSSRPERREKEASLRRVLTLTLMGLMVAGFASAQTAPDAQGAIARSAASAAFPAPAASASSDATVAATPSADQQGGGASVPDYAGSRFTSARRIC